MTTTVRWMTSEYSAARISTITTTTQKTAMKAQALAIRSPVLIVEASGLPT